MMIVKMKASPLFQGFVHTQESSNDLLKNGNHRVPGLSVLHTVFWHIVQHISPQDPSNSTFFLEADSLVSCENLQDRPPPCF